MWDPKKGSYNKVLRCTKSYKIPIPCDFKQVLLRLATLPYFYVICDLQLNRHTGKWNLFVYFFSVFLCPPSPNPPCLRTCFYCRAKYHCLTFFMCRDMAQKMYMYTERELFDYCFLAIYTLASQSRYATNILQIKGYVLFVLTVILN